MDTEEEKDGCTLSPNQVGERDKWLALVDLSADGWILVDRDWIIVETSQKNLYKKYNIQNLNIIGRSLLDFVPNLERTRLYRECNAMLSSGSGQVVQYIVSYPVFGGIPEDVVLWVKAAKLGDGLCIVTTNITEQKKAEKALQWSMERYRVVTENATDTIWTMNYEGKLTYLSPSAESMLGYALSEILGRDTIEFLDPAFARTGIAAIKRALADKTDSVREAPLELALLHKNGTRVWTETRLALMRYPDGRPPEVLGVTRDTTVSRRLHNLFRSLADNVPVGVYILQDGRFGFLNRQFQQYAGYSASDIINSQWMRFVYPPDRNRVRKNAIQMLRGKRADPYSYRFVDSSGMARWVLERVTSIEYGEGRATLGCFMDITTQKRAQDEVRRSESRLKLLSQQIISVQEKERSRLAQELHDDVGQSLFAARIQGDSLAERLENFPDYADQVRELVDAISGIEEAVRTIAIASRPPALANSGLVEAVQCLAEDFERRSGISCPIEAYVDQDITLPEHLSICAYRVLQEALTNAWKHSEASQVAVSLRAAVHSLRLSISDDGLGMNTAALSGKSSMGLLGMRERVRLVGGKLSIMSKKGGGVRIVAVLPIR